MKVFILFFALFSATALTAQPPCLGCPKGGATLPTVASRPRAEAAQIPALPRFDFTSAKYFWVYNGDRGGKWDDVRITIADGKVAIQMPYAGVVFNVESAQYNAVDDVHEYKFTNGNASLDIEFMQSDWAIDYIRLTTGNAGSNTYFEWYPQIYDFIAQIKTKP